MKVVHTFAVNRWDEFFSQSTQTEATEMLEKGKILFFPQLPFQLHPDEQRFLSPDIADPHSKNIGYHAERNKLWGVQHLTDDQHNRLKSMLERFSRHAFALIHNLMPQYSNHLIMARTSFRPVQIDGRKTSYRKDDKRLHVDAFPSAPNQGKRILRVFCNINPNNEDRLWRVGEPFEDVAQTFIPQISKPLPGTAATLRFLKITKSYRTPYDHYMLQIHDRMKADDQYQTKANQQEVNFPANSTWID